MILIYLYFALFLLQKNVFIKGDYQVEDFQVEDFQKGRDNFLNAFNFKGKVALVTGSNSGIGEATVKLLSSLGAQVVVTGRNATRIQQVAAECKILSPYKFAPLAIQADLLYVENRQRLVNETIKKFKQIDILVNLAGIGLFATILDPDYAKSCNELRNINLEAVMDMCRLAAPYLLLSNGTIVNIASVLANNPLAAGTCYSTTKGAVIAFTESLTSELSPKVRINVISPGLILNTRIFRYIGGVPPGFYETIVGATALKRAGEPVDIANVIAFLASSLAGYINGRNIVVDGGLFVPLHT